LTILNEEQRDFFSGDIYRKYHSKWSAPSGCTNAFFEVDNSTLQSIGAGDIITAGLVQQAHNEFLYESIWYPQSGDKKPLRNTSYISVTVSNMAALSRGSVTIGSNYALGDPVIDPNVRGPFYRLIFPTLD
jgi:hypothetical protein